MLDKIKLKLIDDKYLDNNGFISNDYKFKLNFPEFNIKDSIIIGKPEEKFETKLFLPIGEVMKKVKVAYEQKGILNLVINM
jgi:hypothetical protein